MTLIDRLEAEYLPRLRALEAMLRQRHPEARFHVGSSSVGSLTSYQGHDIYLECTWMDRAAAEADNLALTISLCHLDRLPRLMADVCWADGCNEDSLDAGRTSSDHWPEANDEGLARLGEAFPRLWRAFEDSVARGRPGSRAG